MKRTRVSTAGREKRVGSALTKNASGHLLFRKEAMKDQRTLAGRERDGSVTFNDEQTNRSGRGAEEELRCRLPRRQGLREASIGGKRAGPRTGESRGTERHHTQRSADTRRVTKCGGCLVQGAGGVRPIFPLPAGGKKEGVCGSTSGRVRPTKERQERVSCDFLLMRGKQGRRCLASAVPVLEVGEIREGGTRRSPAWVGISGSGRA